MLLYDKRMFVIVLLTLSSVLGCSNTQPTPTSGSAQEFAGQVLHVFNWSDYIDPAILGEFETRTGARVQYDTYSSDAELETKLLTGASGYDVIFPSDRSIPMLIKKELLAPINKEKLTNLKHLDPKFLSPPYDSKGEYVLPYFWGTAAVGIRADHVKTNPKGFEVLFDPLYKGHITLLDDPENVVAVTLMHLGHPMNSLDDIHLAEVKQLLLKQRPLIQAYTSDDYKERLIKGDTWVALGWSGDILQARKEQSNVKAIIPESGTMLWIDAMAIPKGARQTELAHRFIDFLSDPEIAAKNANFVRYASPNLTAKAKLDADLLNDPAVYPSAEILSRCEWLLDRGEGIRKIEKLWNEVRNE